MSDFDFCRDCLTTDENECVHVLYSKAVERIERLGGDLKTAREVVLQIIDSVYASDDPKDAFIIRPRHSISAEHWIAWINALKAKALPPLSSSTPEGKPSDSVTFYDIWKDGKLVGRFTEVEWKAAERPEVKSED